jgi:hypothetical protein
VWVWFNSLTLSRQTHARDRGVVAFACLVQADTWHTHMTHTRPMKEAHCKQVEQTGHAQASNTATPISRGEGPLCQQATATSRASDHNCIWAATRALSRQSDVQRQRCTSLMDDTVPCTGSDVHGAVQWQQCTNHMDDTMHCTGSGARVALHRHWCASHMDDTMHCTGSGAHVTLHRQWCTSHMDGTMHCTCIGQWQCEVQRHDCLTSEPVTYMVRLIDNNHATAIRPQHPARHFCMGAPAARAALNVLARPLAAVRLHHAASSRRVAPPVVVGSWSGRHAPRDAARAWPCS